MDLWLPNLIRQPSSSVVCGVSNPLGWVHSVDNLPERLPVRAIDERSGFINFSTLVQVPNALEFFKEDTYVYLSCISTVTSWKKMLNENI